MDPAMSRHILCLLAASWRAGRLMSCGGMKLACTNPCRSKLANRKPVSDEEAGTIITEAL